MRRRDLVVLGALAFTLPGIGRTQNKTPVIGLLWNDSVKPSPYIAVLADALRERGWRVGRDVQFEDRISLQGYSAYAEDAAALVRAKVDLIFAYGSTSVFAVAKATKAIPIVMHIGVDPVASGLVASLARPGGNLTGVTTLATGLHAKRIELLKELNPGLTTIGVLLTPNVGNPTYVRDSEGAARELRLQVHFAQADKAEAVDGAIAELAKKRVGALCIAPSSMLAANSQRVVDAVAKHGLPAVYNTEAYADAGGLMVYGLNTRKGFVRAASHVDRILRGARPADLAIEQISDVALLVNLRTARASGIAVPASLLVRADRVIE